MLGRATDYALNSVSGAAMGENLDPDVGNAVVSRALTYAIQHCSAWMHNWLGGGQEIRARIITRLKLKSKGGVVKAGVLASPAQSP
jgi:hypothetical protein